MLELNVKIRQATGKKNKQLREKGIIPAVLYGHNIKNLSLSVDEVDFERVYKEAGESTLIKLKIDGEESKKERVVLIHELERDAVNDKPIHIDFYQVKMDEVIKTEIPLVFIGESQVVKQEGGLLIKNIQSIEIEALPQDLPHQIEVDISSLKTFDDNISVKDLKIPDKVKIMAEPEEVIATVVPPRTQEELEELEEKPAEQLEEIKVETEEKKEEKETEAKEQPKEE